MRWMLIALLALAAGAAVAFAGDDATLFTDNKCNMCHSVSSAGVEAKTKAEAMKGPDLTGVTARRDADWIGKFLRKEADIDGKKHKGSFKGSDDDLAALIAWLETQK